MNTHRIPLIIGTALLLCACESSDSNATYDRAMDRQLYEQDLQLKQFMGQSFGKYGGPQVLLSPQDLYRLPTSR